MIDNFVNNFTKKDIFHINQDSGKFADIKKIYKLFLIGVGILIIVFVFFLFLMLTTNYSKLDEFEDYLEEFNEGKYITRFNELNLGIKIMPSYNLEDNVLYMRHSTDPYKSIISGSASLANSFDIKQTFFRTNQTRKVFPKFSFKQDNVPLGDSLSLCLSANWGLIERGKHFEIMKPVQGFSQCSSANEQIIWNEDDSIYGIDIPAWKQTTHEIDCNYEYCADYCKNKYGGAFVKGVNKNFCYTYEILEGICIVVKYEPLRDEYIFYGGCYPGNHTYKLEQGKLGEEVNFNNVEIEIREFNDPIAQAGELTNYKYHFGQFWRYISFLMKILLVVSIGLLGYTTYLIIQEKNELKNKPTILATNEVEPGNKLDEIND